MNRLTRSLIAILLFVAVSGIRAQSVTGTGLSFDGVNDYVSFAAPTVSNLQTFTLEAWVKPTAGGGTIYSEGLTTSLTPVFSIIYTPNGNDGFEIILRNASNTGLAVSTTNGALVLNQWSHVAFVRTSATTAQLYINGALTDHFTFADPGFIQLDVANLGVRQRSNKEYYFTGSMDEVRMWNRALCQAEIQNNKDCELNAATQTGLLSLYNFNQGVAGGDNTPAPVITVPGAPLITNVSAGNAQATVTFNAPASNGGSAISSYTVTSSPGGFTASGSSSPLTVPGLTNGQSYTFTVTARNANGTGAMSAPSSSVIPSTVPDAPTITSVIGGDGQAVVSFTPPASDGGSPITNYRIVANPGGIIQSANTSPFTFTGLTNGQSYTFRVGAANVNGNGPNSATSSPTLIAAPVVDNAKWRIAVPNDQLAADIDPMTGYAVLANGAEYDPFTLEATLPAPSPAIPVYRFPDSYVVTLNPLSFELTTSRYTVINRDAREERDFSGNLIRTLPGDAQIYYVTTTGTFVDSQNDQVQVNPGTLDVLAVGEAYIIQPTPLKFRSNYVASESAAAMRKANKADTQTVSARARLLNKNEGQTSSSVFTEKPNYVVGPYDYSNSTVGDHIELSGNIITSYDNYAAEPIRTSAAITAGNITGTTTLIDATGNNNGTLNNFALTGNTSNWTTGIASGNCAVFVTPVAPITGVNRVCAGSTTALSNAITGGTWSSNNSPVATVSATGVVSGVMAGTAIITYLNNCGGVSNMTVTVNGLPSGKTSQVGSNTFCAGGSTILTATGAGAYLWSNNETTQSITVTASGNYSVTVTDANNCSATSAAYAIVVNPAPTATVTANAPTTFCTGGQVVLTASAGSSYLWSNNATTQSITVNASGNYSVTVTGANNCSATSAATVVTVSTLPVITVSASASSICIGGSTVLTATGAQDYVWMPGSLTGASITVSPTTNTNYTVIGTSAGGCSAIPADNWQAVAAGLNHTLALRTDGTLYGTGANSSGQLGDGTTTNSTSFKQAGAATWTSIAAGSAVSYGIKPDGGLWAWGNNITGQMGDGSNTSSLIPVHVGSATWLKVTAGAGFALGIQTDGSLWAWGDNTYGQLGNGTTTGTNAPVKIGSSTWTSISTGDDFTYGIKSNGTLWAWGHNNGYQLGLGNNTAVVSSPVQVGTATWLTTEGGQAHGLGIQTNGTLWGWGNGSTSGALGLGATITFTIPTQVGTSTWLKIATAYRHTLGIKTDGSLWAWGDNTFGQSGYGNTTGSNVPVLVDNNQWTDIAALSNTSLGLRANGALMGSGIGNNGVIGNGNLANVTSFVQTPGLTITVNALPTVAAITGTTAVCVNKTTQLNDATAGGVWSSDNTTVATVSTAGLITGLQAGTAVISYTVTNANNCTKTVTATVTVNALPVVAGITGTTTVCAGSTGQLSNSTNGGVWSSSNGSIASVNATGLVSGVAAGTATITYTVTNANNCKTAVTASVTVNALQTPTFAQVAAICSGTALAVLPTTSDNNITGTWSPAINNTATTTYTFTPTAGQCATTATMSITVNPLPTVTGTLGTCAGGARQLTGAGTPAASNPWTSSDPSVATVNNTGLVSGVTTAGGNTVITYTNVNGCPITANFIVFTTPPTPTASAVNNCDGTSVLTASGFTGYQWYNFVTLATTTGNSLTVNTPGTYQVRSASANCVSPWFFITANPHTAPVVNINADGPTTFCTGAQVVLTASAGSSYLWSNNATTQSITVNATGNYSVTVTDANNCSATSTVTAVTVNPLQTPTFAQVAAICSGTVLSALPTTSTNGITGTWSPAINNTATTTYTFTPTAGQCATTATMTIAVNPNVTPTFVQVAAICSGTVLSALPTTSTNGITGTWSPAINNTATTTYTFTPTAGLCATTATMTIAVNPNVTSTFVQVAAICSGTVLSALPTSSTNNITGTWSPAINNTATTTYTFTPTAGQCATTATMTIAVNPNVTPTFTQVAAICSGTILSALPTTSTNGITGTWSPALNNTATTTYTFTPTAGLCATTATMTITVNPFPTVAAITGTTSVCISSTTQLNNITGGGIWSSNATGVAAVDNTGKLTGISNGTAVISYAVTNANNCVTTVTTTITVNTLPVVTATSNSPVNAYGTLNLNASGADTYTWSGVNAYSATGASPSVTNVSSNTAGGYMVTGTNTVTGCVNTASTNVAVNYVQATGLNFDGVDDHISINNTLGNFGTGDFSIEMQVKTGATNLQYLLSKRNNCGPDNFISMQLAGGKLSVEVAGDGGADYTGILGTTSVNDNNWHQVAATRVNGLISLYVDGVFQASGYSNANINNNYALTLGSSVCNGQNGSLPFNGSMDEVRFWSRGLCVDEILNNKDCELNAATQTGLLALYHFNQGLAGGDNTPVAVITAPGAPLITNIIVGNGQATVSFNAPASDGGSAITSYTVTSSPGGFTASGSSSPLTVPGLTNGQSYTFTVTARNATGTGALSAPSSSVIPSTVPDAPTLTSVIGGDGQAVISFTPPASDGGSLITNYRIVANPGGIIQSANTSPFTFTGLTNGQSYTFRVGAANVNGNGPNSATSSPTLIAAPIVDNAKWRIAVPNANCLCEIDPMTGNCVRFDGAEFDPLTREETLPTPSSAIPIYRFPFTYIVTLNPTTFELTTSNYTVINIDGREERDFYGNLIRNIPGDAQIYYVTTTGAFVDSQNDQVQVVPETLDVLAIGEPYTIQPTPLAFRSNYIPSAPAAAIRKTNKADTQTVSARARLLNKNEGQTSSSIFTEKPNYVVGPYDYSNSTAGDHIELTGNIITSYNNYSAEPVSTPAAITANNISVTTLLIDATGNNSGTLDNFALTGNTSNWTIGIAAGNCAPFVATATPITGTNSVCIGSTTALNAGSGGRWSSNNSPVAIVSATGVVSGVMAGTAIITYLNNCGGVSSMTVTVNPLPSGKTSQVGSNTFCAGGSTILTATGAGAYLWSNSATTQSITVTTSGNYNVTITDANNCSATSAAYTIVVNPVPTATVTADGPTTFCAGGRVVLTASAGSSYLWSNNETTQSITVNASGNYSVTVTNANNCSATSAVTSVRVNPLPTATVAADGPTTFCAGGQVVLTASAGSSYLWSNNATAQSITVNATGNYSVNVTENGCTARSAALAVTVNEKPADITYTVTPNCDGSTTITANNITGTVLWAPGNETGNSITVFSSGMYGAVQTGNGCSSNPTSVLVRIIPAPSIFGITSGNASFCAGSIGSMNIILSGSETGVTYTLLRDGTPTGATLPGTGDAISFENRSEAGTYTIQATAAGLPPNCTVTMYNISVLFMEPLPIVTFSNVPELTCAGNSAQFDIVTNAHNSSVKVYVSATGAEEADGTLQFGSNFTTPVLTATTTYYVEVTSQEGCVSARVPVTLNVIDFVIQPITGIRTVCAGSTTQLTNTTTGGEWWTADANILTIDQNGLVTGLSAGTTIVYYVVTNEAGCTSMQEIAITVNDTPVPIITASGAVDFCPAGSVTLVSSSETGNTWSNGETTQSIVVNTAGSYSVMVNNGCAAKQSNVIEVSVTDVTAPVPVMAILPTITSECSVTVNISGGQTPPPGGSAPPQPADSPAPPPGGSAPPPAAGSAPPQPAGSAPPQPAGSAPPQPSGSAPPPQSTPTGLIINAPVAMDECAGMITGTTNDPLTYAQQGTYIIRWTFDDGHGNTTTQEQTVIIRDVTAPVPEMETLPTITGECSATVTAPKAFDNCSGTITGTTADDTSYTEQGTYTITWTFDDGHNNITTQTQTVIVRDITPPMISCNPITVQLGADGRYVLNQDDLLRLAGDSTQYAAMAEMQFTQAQDAESGYEAALEQQVETAVVLAEYQQGLNELEAWYAELEEPTPDDDEYYDINRAFFIQTISFFQNRLLIATQRVAVLQADLAAHTPPANQPVTIVGFPSDNCGIATITASKNMFDCSNLGENEVTITVTDIHGNSSSCTTTVTVQDLIVPVITEPLPVVLNNTAGICGANNAALAIPVVADNCTVTITNDAPAVLPIGTTIVTWTAQDASSNTVTATQTVTVVDVERPVPVLAILPTVTGECSATVTAPSAVDNCSGTILGTTTDSLSYSRQGSYTVTWTYDDGNHNITTQTQTVIVRDVTAPVPVVATLPMITGECSATVTAPSAIDNCAGTIIGTTTDSLSYSRQGSYTVTWAYDDGNHNITTQTQTVIVRDVTAPVPVVATLPIITGECSATVTAPSAIDNCAGTIIGTTTDSLSYSRQGSYTVTWAYDDGNHNITTQTQTVVVRDVTAPVPVVTTLPTITGECSASVKAPIAIDNCSGIIVGTTSDSLSYSRQGSYTITWTYDDGNRNITTQTQTVVVRDVTAPVPVVATLPTITGECSASVTAPRAIDNCSGIIIGTTTDSLSYSTQGSHIITWTYDDGNHNITTQTQTVIVRDMTAPVPVVASLPTITSECSATVKVPTAIDNCSGIIIGRTTDSLSYSTQGSHIITWTYDDGNHNITTQTQTVVVRDVTPPTITCSANINVYATSASGVQVNYASPVVSDNCTVVSTVMTSGFASGSTFPIGTTVVTHVVTDKAGLTAECSFTVTVTGLAPQINCPGNITVFNTVNQCGANVSFVASETTAIPASVITYSIASGSFFPIGTTTVTVTATNAVGVSTCSFLVTVIDNQLPVLTGVPANVTVECNAVPAAAVVTASDNCTTSAVIYTESRTDGNCANNYSLTRTWSTTDASGNTTTASQKITVEDTQKPVLSEAPTNVTVECNAVPAAAILAATDNCSTPAVVYNEVRTNGTSPGNYTLTRTWTATDACGNSCTKTQVITVRDTQAPIPIVTVLPTLTGDCSVVATAPTAADNCAGVITGTTLNATSYTAQGVYTITWSYSDGNGNTSSQTQRVVVKDVTPPMPTVTVIPTVTGQCSATVTAKPTATDACSGVTAAGTTTDPLTYSAQGTYTIHWMYVDNLGNKSYQDQTVIVKDNMAPVPNVASLPTIEGQCSVNITMVTSTRCTDNCTCCRVVCHCRSSECNCRGWAEWISNILSYFFGVSNNDDNHGCDHDDDAEDVNNMKMQAPTANDNCKGTIIGTTTDPLSYSTQGTYTIHWNFNDGNGNISVQNQTVVVADVEAPVPNANSLPTVYGTCSATVTAKPTAKDNCVGTVTGTTTDPLSYSTQGTFVIHWSFSDGHGNTTTQNQTVIIQDNTKPVINEPNDITISCGTSILPAATGNATATDNCSGVVISYTDVTVGNKITRTWKATDVAGNYATDTQVITIADNTKPVITAPNNVTVNCGTSTLPAATGTATATDNCSTPTITYSDNTNGYVIIRTWKAKDAAGNYSTATQTVTIVDNVKPTIAVPNNVAVNCGSSTSPSATGTATGTDACSSVTISYSDASANNVITRTWKATDASGNFITSAQAITIVDNIKPVITDVPDITISCGSSTTPEACNSVAKATDNCSTPVVTYSDVTVGNKITRTWQAKDAAGNIATSTQIITIVDNTKPVLTEPNDITINCGSSTLPSATGNATATDACSAPTITYTDVQSGNVITRTWKATDAAGNYDTDVQKITIGSSFTATLTSVPTVSTYTGGVSTNLYLGYGAQSTTLTMCSLPSSGAPYTYVWSGTASNKLNSTTTASPVFTPATFGYYTFSVTVTNKYGCTSATNISICVTDIRVAGTNGAKVYVCHSTSSGHGSSTNTTQQVAINQVASHIGNNNCGGNGNDRLGSCDQSPCNTTVVNSIAATTATKSTAETVANSEEGLKVTVMPNPTTTYFTLKLESKFDTPVNMRIMDGRGRVVDAKSKIGANSTIQIGHNYSSGTYYAELIQGNTKKVVQMIKGRG